MMQISQATFMIEEMLRVYILVLPHKVQPNIIIIIIILILVKPIDYENESDNLESNQLDSNGHLTLKIRNS